MRADEACQTIRAVDIKEIGSKDKTSVFGFALAVLPNAGDWRREPLCLKDQQLDAIRGAVERAIVTAGYLSTRLAFGADSVRDGVLELTAFPGSISQILPKPIRWDLAVQACSPEVQQTTQLTPLGIVGAIQDVQPEVQIDLPNSRVNFDWALPPIVNKWKFRQDLEEGIYNLRRPSAGVACFALLPGAGAGQSTLVLLWSQRQLVRLNLSIDDSGTKATGKTQGTLSGECANCLASNEIVTVSTTRNLTGEKGVGHGTRANMLTLWVPYRYWKFGADASQSTYAQNVAGQNQTYVYSGTTTNFNARVAKTVFRGEASRLEVAGQVWIRSSSNAIDDSDIEVQRRRMAGWAVEVTRESTIGERTEFNAKLGFKKGTGSFGSISAPEESFGEGTSKPSIITATAFLRTSVFPSQPRLALVSIEFRGQWNRTPLVPQDRFAIGGRNTVRGFDGENTLAADRGWLLRSEVRVPVPLGSTDFYLGLDHGEVGGQSAARLAGRSLTGGAIGIQSRGGYRSFDLVADFFIGAPIDRPAGFSTSSRSAGFLLSASY